MSLKPKHNSRKKTTLSGTQLSRQLFKERRLHSACTKSSDLIRRQAKHIELLQKVIKRTQLQLADYNLQMKEAKKQLTCFKNQFASNALRKAQISQSNKALSRIDILTDFGEFNIAHETIRVSSHVLAGTTTYTLLRQTCRLLNASVLSLVPLKSASGVIQVVHASIHDLSLHPQKCSLTSGDIISCMRMNQPWRTKMSKFGKEFLQFIKANKMFESYFIEWMAKDRLECIVTHNSACYSHFAPLLFPDNERHQHMLNQKFRICNLLEWRWRVPIYSKVGRSRVWKLNV